MKWRLSTSIPRWVKEYPVDLDREALMGLAKASQTPLDTPREMNFSIYEFKTKEDAENAVHQIEEQGWSCTLQKQVDDSRYFVIDATKQGYVLAEETYSADVAFFSRIADMYGAEYDGWYASA